MALRNDFEVSTRPVTMQDVILNYRTQRGDMEAFLLLIVSRTNLTEAEILALDLEEVNTVAVAIGEGLNAANTLAAIGKMLDGSDSSGS